MPSPKPKTFTLDPTSAEVRTIGNGVSAQVYALLWRLHAAGEGDDDAKGFGGFLGGLSAILQYVSCSAATDAQIKALVASQTDHILAEIRAGRARGGSQTGRC
jgi:hypothetical protein